VGAGQPLVPGRGEDVAQAGLVHHQQVGPPGPLGQAQAPEGDREQGRLVLQHPADLLELPADRGRLGGPVAPLGRPLGPAAGAQAPQRPLEGLAGQHARPAGPRRREGSAEQGQAALEVLPGRGHLAQLDMGLGQQAMPAGPHGGRHLAAAQGGPEHGLGLPEPAPVAVQRAQPGEVAVEVGRVAGGDQPVGGRPEVLDVGDQLGPGRERAGGVGEQAREVGGVAAPHLGLLGRVGGQAARGVLAQELMHAVAAVLAHLDQGVVDQAGQQGQPGPGHGGRGVQVEAAAQDREPPQGLALVVGEQLPGPVDHRPDAAVAGGDVGGGRLQQLGPAGQPVGNGRRGG